MGYFSFTLRYFAFCCVICRLAKANTTDSSGALDQKYVITFNETVPSMIKAAGYPLQIHHVTTEDGYILELHRIPNGRYLRDETVVEEGKLCGPPAVFMHHGLTSSSADFIMNDGRKALAYMLADAGYDVWMANARGNSYSKHHTTLKPYQPKFFRFSWDQMVRYDVPAEIDYILNMTKQQQIKYVGFSMGTSIFFGLSTIRPDIANKVQAMAAIAPVAYLKHAKGLLAELAPSAETIDTLMHILGITAVLEGDRLMDEEVVEMCGEPYSDKMSACIKTLSGIVGPDLGEFYQEILPLAMTLTPATVSTHTLLQYAQLVVSGRFCMLDYGTAYNNNVNYDRDHPPNYRLDRVRTPVALFHGSNDFLSTPKDVAKMKEELPNVVSTTYIDDPPFNHLHFLWGKHAPVLVYERVLDFFATYKTS